MLMTQKKFFLLSLGILLAAAVWIILTALWSKGEVSPRTSAPRQGFIAPDFSLPASQGDESVTAGSLLQLSRMRGKVVVINFWASWCTPCQQEMPAIQAVYQAYHASGLEVLAVNAEGDDQDAARDLLTNLALTFPVLLDTQGAAAQLYEVNAYPTTFFVDRGGIIQRVVVGGPMPEALLRAQVQQMLNQKSPQEDK
jgi:thiol-disulfide isomerase/thioredoxin